VAKAKPKRSKKRQRKKLPPKPNKPERELRTEGAPADAQQRGVRFLTKKEVCERVRLTFPTIWKRMRDRTFPRAREMSPDQQSGIKIVWLEHEVEDWMVGLPAREYLGEIKKVGDNVRIKGSPHHSTIMKGGAQRHA
jgi:predicted DNA-binding transcriptional regulator AlpA